MGYGDVLVHTNGPSYGQNIVRNVGTAGGGGGGAPDAHKASHEDGGADELDLTGLSGGFQNPYPDPVTFQSVVDFSDDVEMVADKHLYLDAATQAGFRADANNLGGLWVDLGTIGNYLLANPSGGAGGSFYFGLGSDVAGNIVTSLLFSPVAITVTGSGAGSSTRTVMIAPSHAERAGLNIQEGVPITVPVNGNVYQDGAAHFHTLGGVDREVMYV